MILFLFNHKKTIISDCRLRNDPKLVALVLMEAEKQGADELQHIAHVIMSGVYGNCVMQEDEALVLQVHVYFSCTLG